MSGGGDFICRFFGSPPALLLDSYQATTHRKLSALTPPPPPLPPVSAGRCNNALISAREDRQALPLLRPTPPLSAAPADQFTLAGSYELALVAAFSFDEPNAQPLDIIIDQRKNGLLLLPPPPASIFPPPQALLARCTAAGAPRRFGEEKAGGGGKRLTASSLGLDLEPGEEAARRCLCLCLPPPRAPPSPFPLFLRIQA